MTSPDILHYLMGIGSPWFSIVLYLLLYSELKTVGYRLTRIEKFLDNNTEVK